MTSTSASMKRCAKCQQDLPATNEYFPSHKAHADGLNSQCKTCTNAAQRARRAHPPTPIPDGHKRCTHCKRVLPKTSEYFYSNNKRSLHSKCKECDKAIKRKRPIDILPEGYKRCGTCKEIKPATTEYFYPRKGRTAFLEPSCKICRRAYFARVVSPEKRLAYSRKYEALPKYQEKRKEYRRTHKQESLIRYRNRRTRQKNVPGTLTSQQIQYKLRKQRFRCYYCFAKFEKQSGKYVYHLDHTIPISRPEAGPRHDMSFTVLACPTCNLSKGHKLLHEWPAGGRLF